MTLEDLLKIEIEKVREPKEIIDSLRAEITKHNYYYYIKDTPIISDADYDRLMLNLEALEKKISRT